MDYGGLEDQVDPARQQGSCCAVSVRLDLQM